MIHRSRNKTPFAARTMNRWPPRERWMGPNANRSDQSLALFLFVSRAPCTRPGRPEEIRREAREYLINWVNHSFINPKVCSYLFLQNDVLALPVLHHAQRLQCAHNVVRVDGHFLFRIRQRGNSQVHQSPIGREFNYRPSASTHLWQVLNIQMCSRAGAQIIQEHVLPVGPVRDQTQVGQGLLRGSYFPLYSSQ